VRFLLADSSRSRARLAGPLPRKGEAVNKSETVIKQCHCARSLQTEQFSQNQTETKL